MASISLRLLSIAAMCAGPCAIAKAQTPPVIRDLESTIQKAIAKAEPAIACIIVHREVPASQNQGKKALEVDASTNDDLPDSFGSGVVIDHRLLLTNYHVIRGATNIEVRLPALNDEPGNRRQSRFSRARIYAADNRSDLAVLQLSEHDIKTPPIELGRGEELKKGSFVIALANPYAIGQRDGSSSASFGIISNLRRRLPGSPREEERTKALSNYDTLLQTDAKLQLGCSGGALLDMEGRLVGLTTAQAALAGSEVLGGYALPLGANTRRIVELLRRGEEVEYGFLGVTTDRFQGRRPRPGVVIEGVTPNSPAWRAGLQPRDIITTVNGESVREFEDMFHHISLGLAGREVTLQIARFRESEPRTIKVVLAKSPTSESAVAINRPRPIHGLRVDWTSVLARGGDPPIPDGVVVREVEKDTPAASASLVENVDIISEVNGVRVSNPAEFYREAEKAVQKNQPVRLTLSNPIRTVTLP